jgi:hypothetical protein
MSFLFLPKAIYYGRLLTRAIAKHYSGKKIRGYDIIPSLTVWKE